jgi:hypothetical protein
MKTDFDLFWAAYPRRNGKKVGKHDCRVWFLKNNPPLDKILEWIKTDSANRSLATEKKMFYANLPDPIRFLKRAMWEDDIEPIAKKRSDTCHSTDCDRPWSGTFENRQYCTPCLKELRGY